MLLERERDPYENVALEEALFVNNPVDALTVRVWNNARSVVIGRAQLARFETDVDLCLSEGIPIVRRFTGGGAVYHGPGNLNWSIAVGRDFSAGGIRYAWDAREAFRVSAYLVTEAIGMCGAEARFEGPANRIVSPEGKVSGMAAYLSKDGMFCHGTLLLRADLEEAARLTTPARVDLERRYTRSSPMKVANLKIEQERFVASLSAVVAERAGTALEAGSPTEEALDAVRTMLPRYRSAAWNLGDPFSSTTA